MKNCTAALLLGALALTTQATKLQQDDDLPNMQDEYDDLVQPEGCGEFQFLNGDHCQPCPALCRVCSTADTCDKCIDHAHFDEDLGSCHCNRKLEHWPVTNTCYQPELCENEILFASVRGASEAVHLELGSKVEVSAGISSTSDYCPMDCRLFIQEHGLV